MEVQVSYQNRRRSDQAELFLEESMQRLEPLNPQITRAKADVRADPSGTNVVQLHVIAPKPFEMVVSAKHENLYAAIRLAVTKLRRVLVKAKDKSVRRRKGSAPVSAALRQSPPPPEPMDATNVLKLESARKRQEKRSALRIVPPTESDKALVDTRKQPNVSQMVIEKVPGIGHTRALSLRKHLGLQTVDDLAKAAWNSELNQLPGFGKKLEAQILKNVMDMKIDQRPSM